MKSFDKGKEFAKVFFSDFKNHPEHLGPKFSWEHFCTHSIPTFAQLQTPYKTKKCTANFVRGATVQALLLLETELGST